MKFGLLHLGLVPLLTSCSEAALSKALSSEDAEMADAGSAAENYDDGDYGGYSGRRRGDGSKPSYWAPLIGGNGNTPFKPEVHE